MEKFLGLKPYVGEHTFIKGPKNFTCWKTQKFKTKGRKIKIKDTYYRCMGGYTGRKHPEVTDEIKALTKWLKHYYTPYNKEFFDLIGEYFEWKMDTI